MDSPDEAELRRRYEGLGSSEVSFEDWLDAHHQTQAFANWNARIDQEWQAAATFLALRYPSRWGPPPDDVTIGDVCRWTGSPEPDVRRWLYLPEEGLYPPTRFMDLEDEA